MESRRELSASAVDILGNRRTSVLTPTLGAFKLCVGQGNSVIDTKIRIEIIKC